MAGNVVSLGLGHRGLCFGCVDHRNGPCALKRVQCCKGMDVKHRHLKLGGHGEANPNTNWFLSRGLWFSYCLGMLATHIILLSIPFLTVPLAWTVTNVFHNSVHLIFLHTLKGTPWLSQDQGECRRLTHWEQIDNGLQFTKTKKFLSVMPIILFFLTNFYTKYDPAHFYINFISLLVVLLPKLPHFHKVRLFGINKY